MRVPHFLMFTLGLSAALALFGCSRESSVKENVNLKNNHSRVFVFNKPIQENFIDSLTNTPVNEADTIPDTLTVDRYCQRLRIYDSHAPLLPGENLPVPVDAH